MTGSCDVRYLNRNNTAEQIANFSKWWQEQLYQFGIKVNYYSAGYQISAADPIYAEDFADAFAIPREIIIGVNITNDASMLSKFGIVTDSDMIVYIHRNTFTQVFGLSAEPKSGDVIELVEVGVDRPGGRGAPKYQITSRDDDDFPVGINPLMSHFLWYVRLKRFEFSRERGITPEPATGIVNDDTIVHSESEEFQGQEKFGQQQYSTVDDSVYGSY